MIVVKIELWPFGYKDRAKSLGTAFIWNKGDSKDPTRGNYGVAVARKGKESYEEIMGEPARRGSVESYPRLSYNVWRLIIRALRSAFPEEK